MRQSDQQIGYTINRIQRIVLINQPLTNRNSFKQASIKVILTVRSKHKHTRAHEHAVRNVIISRVPFLAFVGLKIDNLYKRIVQRDTCSDILQSETLCLDLMPTKGNTFLSRGHLAARSDFIYRSHQRASYYFINVGPQWQSFNAGNWAILEEVR